MATRTLGLLGDVHQEHERLRTALRYLGSARVDAIVCTGDVVDGPGDASETLRLLMDNEVATVRGNHDRWALSATMRDAPGALDVAHLNPDELTFLAALPTTPSYPTQSGALLLCHGLGPDDMCTLGPDDFGYQDALDELGDE